MPLVPSSADGKAPPEQHVSVSLVETCSEKTLPQSTNMPILNPCLAFIQHLMRSRDKTFIQDAVCSRFSLFAIMVARETLYIYSSPQEKYVYRGPNKVTNVRDRSIHAFGGLYSKFIELDALETAPVIACPSVDLGLLISFNDEPVIADSRFRRIENEIEELKRTFHAYTAIVQSSSPSPHVDPASSIQPSTRSRLVSESFKRRRTEDGVVSSTPSESEDSVSETEQDSGYRLPHDQRKKQDRKTYSEKVKELPVNYGKPSYGTNRKPNRPQATWGKGSSLNTNHLSGAPPEIFMFRCGLQVEEENVKEHFKALNIDLIKVCKMTSHPEARTHSFCLTPSKTEDFNKIMTGDFTPPFVGVRKFTTRRNNIRPESKNTLVSDFLRENPEVSIQGKSNERESAASMGGNTGSAGGYSAGSNPQPNDGGK